MLCRSGFSLRFYVAWQFCICVCVASHAADEVEWGQPDKGIQLRILPVRQETDEQSPDFQNARQTSEFRIADDVTLLAQLKNVSRNSISLQGVRFGDSVSKPWPGKSQQAKFGPLVFQTRLYDKDGTLVEPPTASSPQTLAMLEFSSGQVEVLKPNESVTMQIKPIQWNSSLATFIESGNYQIELEYRGTPKPIQDQIKKHWPTKPLGNVWHGAAKSARVNIQIQKSYRDLRPKLAWGKPNKGLRVAAEYRLSDTRAEDPQEFIDRTFPVGSQVNVRYYFQNTSTKPLNFSSDLWRQDDTILIVTDQGNRKLNHPWYSGIARRKTWTIKPKQIVTVDAIALSFPPENDDPTFKSFGAEIDSGPGEYRIRHELSELDLSTGTSLLTVRQREPRDEPPMFNTTIVFRKPDRTIAENGFVTVRTQPDGKQLFEGELPGGSLKLKKWTGETLSIYARFPTCEENTFFDVVGKKGGETAIDLSKSDPILMRLVDEDGHPVTDANVRFFVRTGEKSKSYPFPIKGIEGPVYAVSDENGVVKLDTVQSGHIYTVYIEPVNLAPMFISGIEVGTDLGEVELVPPFEISGIIKGSPEQLRRFAAEWDQPAEMILADGSTSFIYAVSKKLQATRDGDQLKFRLSGLRPGKLRIIANFGPRPHSVGHVYERRKVGPKDKLFEFDISESRDDFVIEAQAK